MTADPSAAPPPQPAPATPPAGDATPPPVTDWQAEAARLQAEAERWKGHSRDWETKAKANLTAAQQAEANKEQLAKVAAALGLAPDTPPDPEQIAAELAAAKAQTAQLARERAVLLAAGPAGADAAGLLDSRAFTDSIKSIDPADTDAITAAIKTAVAVNSRYAATPTTPAAPAGARSNAAGGFAQPTTDRQWTADDVARATPAQLSKAMADGRLKSYMNQ
jgi:hypothetical protein